VNWRANHHLNLMYTTIVLLLFVAFLLLYNLSKKSKWETKTDWVVKMASQPVLTRVISFSMMVISCLILICINGLASGIFGFIVILMAMGSLIVLLFPFHYLSTKHVVILYVLFAGLELFIF